MFSWRKLRCLLRWCAGRIDHDRRGVYWQCATCGRRDYAHENCWDYYPVDGPRRGPVE